MKFTQLEIEKVKEQFPNSYTGTIAKSLNRTYTSIANLAFRLGIKKSEDFRRLELERQGARLRLIGTNSQFLKGSIPANKGKRMSSELYAKVKPTMFKKGNIPFNTKKPYEQVLRKDKSGREYWMIKIPNETRLKYKHIFIWEATYGKIEKGYNIVFKDKNSLNCVLDNLECLSNAELMSRNTFHRFPDELKSTIRLVNKLKVKCQKIK
jgi:hypothetical protein